MMPIHEALPGWILEAIAQLGSFAREAPRIGPGRRSAFRRRGDGRYMPHQGARERERRRAPRRERGV